MCPAPGAWWGLQSSAAWAVPAPPSPGTCGKWATTALGQPGADVELTRLASVNVRPWRRRGSPHCSWGFLGSLPACGPNRGARTHPAHLIGPVIGPMIGPVSCKGSGPAPPCRSQVGSMARPRSALVAEVRSQLPPDRDWFGRHGVLNRRGRTQLTAAWSRHTRSMLGGERRIAFPACG